MSEDFSEQRLAGRVIVVTGGGHGIGRAYAQRLAAEGAQIVVAEIDAPAADLVAKELVAAGGGAVWVKTDVTDEESVANMVARSIATFGKIDGLVNNAAIFTSVPLERTKPEELSYEHFEEVLRVNVIGTWLCSKLIIPDMRTRPYGKIVNVSSGTAFKGNGTNMLQYVTSKGAILSFTRVLARAVGDDGIRVNCVAPGGTAAEDGLSAAALESYERATTADRAIKQLETPGDVVGTVSFLCAADSDFITGQTISVDGGSAMH